MLRFQRILNRIHIIRLCKSQSGSDMMGVFTSDMRKKGNYYRTAKAYLSVFVNGKKSLSFRVFFSFFVHLPDSYFSYSGVPNNLAGGNLFIFIK